MYNLNTWEWNIFPPHRALFNLKVLLLWEQPRRCRPPSHAKGWWQLTVIVAIKVWLRLQRDEREPLRERTSVWRQMIDCQYCNRMRECVYWWRMEKFSLQEPHDPPTPVASTQERSTSLHSMQYKRQTLKDLYTKDMYRYACMRVCIHTNWQTQFPYLLLGEKRKRRGGQKKPHK